MSRKYQVYRPERDKARFHDSVVTHSNANVRLAADHLALAVKAAKSGNVSDILSHLSLAQLFAEKVNFINPEESFN